MRRLSTCILALTLTISLFGCGGTSTSQMGGATPMSADLSGKPLTNNGGTVTTTDDSAAASLPHVTPPTPTGLHATPTGATMVLVWNASAGATSYHVFRAATSAGPFATVGSPTTRTYTDSAVSPSTVYFYKVTAVNASGQSAPTGALFAKTNPPAPAAPTGLHAAINGAAVSLTWSASSGATSYQVKRSTVSAGPYAVVGTSAITSFSDPTITTATTYFYVVDAVNVGGAGPNSSPVSILTQAGIPPTPTGLHATPTGATIVLVWNASVSATSYHVLRATTVNGTFAVVGSPATRTFTDSTVASGTGYFYKVTATNTHGTSFPTGALYVKSNTAAPPAVPTGLSAVASDTKVALAWTASAGATGYNVRRSTTNGGPYTALASPTTNSYNDTAVVNGTTYYYVVSAVSAAGQSAFSAQVSGTPTTPAGPITVTVSNGGPAGFTFGAGTVKSGGKVQWQNNTFAPHCIHWDTRPSSEDVAVFNAGTTSNSWTAPIVTKSTDFTYHCCIHTAMMGTITVTP